MTVHYKADSALVFANLIEAAIFPDVIYGVDTSPYTTFPFAAGGLCEFQDAARRKGESAFHGDEPDQLYPLILWFYTADADWSMDNALVNNRVMAGTIVVAYQHGDGETIDDAMNRCSRSQALIQEYIGRQSTEYSLTYGPFGKSYTGRVPSFFGTIQNIYDPQFSVVDPRPEPDLGPNVAIGAVAVRLRVLVI